MKRNSPVLFLILTLLTVLFFLLNLKYGSVSTGWKELWEALFNGNEKGNGLIVLSYRLPQALTAVTAGIALGLAGLVLQTLFRNPLAGPSVLGISAGASLGVAVAVLSGGLFNHREIILLNGDLGTVIFAFAGAMSVLSVILFVSQRIAGIITLLIIGVMTGYAVSALVSVLQYFSHPDDMYSFVMWGLGSFSKTDNIQATALFILIITGSTFLIFFAKPLNALLLGEDFARSIGFNVKIVRTVLFLITGFFIAATTAFTGPIGFLGLAVPHLSRTLFKTSNHAVLIPAVAVTGALLALICNLLAKLPGYDITLPVNAVTSLVGAPVVIWILIKNRHFGPGTE